MASSPTAVPGPSGPGWPPRPTAVARRHGRGVRARSPCLPPALGGAEKGWAGAVGADRLGTTGQGETPAQRGPASTCRQKQIWLDDRHWRSDSPALSGGGTAQKTQNCGICLRAVLPFGRCTSVSMLPTWSPSTKLLARTAPPISQASVPARRRVTSGGVALGIAGLLLGFFPAPRALAAELPAGPSAPGTAEALTSGKGEPAATANQAEIAQAPLHWRWPRAGNTPAAAHRGGRPGQATGQPGGLADQRAVPVQL